MIGFSAVEYMVRKTCREADISEMASRMRDESKHQILHEFLEEVFSDNIAETFLKVLDFHVKKTSGKNLIWGILEKPRKTYRAIHDFFGVTGAVRLLEATIARHVKKKYEIIIDDRLISKLKSGDNEAILVAALKIYLTKINRLKDLTNIIDNIDGE